MYILPAGYEKRARYRTFILQRVLLFGAGDVTRTRDLLITSEMLYQLSYTS